MQGNKTPMIIGLVVLIVAVVGILIYQFRGSGIIPGTGTTPQQENVLRQEGGRMGGNFTPAPK